MILFLYFKMKNYIIKMTWCPWFKKSKIEEHPVVEEVKEHIEDLAEDVQDWITSQDAELVATTNLNVTCTQFGSKIFTLVVLDSD